MAKKWIVVAEQSQARFFLVDKVDEPLVELARLDHPIAHKREGELVSDRPGRSFNSVGAGRHAMDPEVEHKEQEAMRFAGEIVDRLEKARGRGDVDEITLVAGPQFLGLLRQKMSAALGEIVRREIPKNLGQYDAREIREHMEQS